MGEKDAAQKILEAYNDVFSDIVNVLLFNGKEVIAPDELEEQVPRAFYKADGKIREIERDVAKRWKKSNIRIACIGLENQTKIDPDMPLRVIGYDGAEYRAQLSDGSSRYPVVTLVLYFGYKTRWDKNLSLKERLDIPPEFDKYVNDYKINLFEIAYLTHEQVAMFQSDFRVVADYFVQKRENGSYVPEPCVLKHVQETLQLLSVMSNDHRFEDIYNERVKEGDIQTMCDVLDRIEEKGREEGRAEGRVEGREEGREEGRAEGHAEGRREGTLDSIKKLVKNMKCTVNEAMDTLEIPLELRDSYKKMLDI